MQHSDPVLGPLGRDPDIDTWWRLAPRAIPFFDGTEVSLVIDDGGVQWPLDRRVVAATQAFLTLGAARHDTAMSTAVHAYYAKWLAAGFSEALAMTTAADVWNHIVPATILFRQDPYGAYALVECHCDWEPEHGLQLVLRDGHRLARVSAYDGHANGLNAADLTLPAIG